MKKLNVSILIVMLITSISAFAYILPAAQTTFKKMYPKASDVAWSQNGNYYLADFMMNGFEKNVWFDGQANWAMTQTELGSLDQLTPVVYNAFVSGPYANGIVEDVTFVEFPKWQAIIVIKVGKDNVDLKYQVFYTPSGILLRARNVSYMHDILGPSTFL